MADSVPCLYIQINVIYKLGFLKIYVYTLVSSKLIVSKEKDLEIIVKSAINSSTCHAAIVENFGTGRKNNMKSSLFNVIKLVVLCISNTMCNPSHQLQTEGLQK